nr:hypothetical protein [Kofleriaceae bacterium]
MIFRFHDEVHVVLLQRHVHDAKAFPSVHAPDRSADRVAHRANPQPTDAALAPTRHVHRLRSPMRLADEMRRIADELPRTPRPFPLPAMRLELECGLHDLAILVHFTQRAQRKLAEN